MKKLIVIIFILFFPLASLASGLQASFGGSRLPCNQYESAIFCMDSTVDGNNNVQDRSGSNIITFSEEFDHANWTKVNTTITQNVVPGPKSDASNLNADLITPSAADSYVYQDAAGVVGTEYTCAFALRSVTGNVDLDIHVYNQTHTAIRESKSITVTPYWRTFYVAARLLTGDTHAGCSLGGGATLSTGENLYAVRGNLAENNPWNPAGGPGIYHYTDATTKPLLNLGPTNAPGWAYSTFQSNNGNRLQARNYNGTDQFDSLAHHDSMDINDGNHTYTFVAKLDLDATQYNALVTHYILDSCGIFLGANVAAGEWTSIYYDNGGSVEVTNNTTTLSDGRYHVVQLVREDDIAVLYVDDVPGSPVDVTGYGLDCPVVLSVGGVLGGFHLYEGDILYMRADAEALSSDNLAYDREILLGIATSQTTVPRSNDEDDGDMEDPGVADWTLFNGAVLSKTMDSPHSGTRALRITYGGVAQPGAFQAVLEIGTRYRMLGFARGDGTWAPVAGYDVVVAWTGTVSTEWQMFDFKFRPTTTFFFLGSNAAGAGYVDYDDVTVIVYNDDIIDFSRYTTAYTTFADGTMAEVAWHIPRVGGDGGGFLIEGQDANRCLQSKTLDSPTWTRTALTTVTPDGSTAPDGTSDMDGLVATVLNVSHGLSQAINLSSAVPHTFSVYAKPGDQDWLYLENSTVANATAYFDIANGRIGTVGAGATAGMESLAYGVRRCWITYTGTVALHTHLIYSAEADGDNVFAGDAVTVNSWLWQAQIETGTFPSSPITTEDVLVTRTKDCADYDIHPDSGTDWMLPMSFGPIGNATKITLYGKWKGLWSSASDIGATRRLINIGSEDFVNNDLELYVETDGKVYLSLTDDGGTVRTINSVAHTTYNNWFTVRAVIDFADLTNSELWINGAVDHDADSNMAGTATWDTEECQLNLGSDRAENVDGYNWHKDLHVTPSEIRAP